MWRAGSAILAFVLLAGAPGSAVAAAPGWSTAKQISDVTMEELANAVDSNGRAYVVGSTRSRGAPLYFLTNASGAWIQSELAQSPRKGAITDVGIAIDNDDSVWIVYQRWSFWNPCFFGCPRGERSRFDGNYLIDNAAGSWSQPRRLPDDFLDIRWSFAVRDGNVHFAYDQSIPGGNFAVWYATNTGGAWQSRKVGRGWGPYLALGASADPWIAYTAIDYAGGVVVAHSAGIGHRFTKSQAPGTAAASETAVVDGLGLNAGGRPVAIVDRYEDGTGYWTYWVRLGRRGWTAPHRLLNDITSAFEIDANSRMHLIYGVGDDSSAGGLYYGSSLGKLADTARIDRSDRFVEDGPAAADSLAVDSNGRPYVVFGVPYNENRSGTWYLVGPVPN